jgi:ATP/maltotriose-dependent transcriptional regulator MalT
VQPEQALRYAQQGLAYAQEHEVITLRPYLATIVAWLRLRAGEWDEAERIVRAEIARETTVPQILARTVLADLAIRRGDEDAPDRLAELAAQADRTGEPQRVVPALELASEWALTNGGPMPVERMRRALDEGRLSFRLAMRFGAWAKVAGLEVDIQAPDRPTPHADMLRGDWKAAADGFGEAGWMHDRGLMLSVLDDAESLAEALEIARDLGADPLARRAARRMRELGLTVPHGPRESTRANPAGLTARQLEVLSLLAAGLTNAEIAEKLVVSPRTAEHHVAAVLTKLGAATRWEAARRGAELGLVTAGAGPAQAR